MAEVFLVICNLIDNQYQQISEILHAFMPNKPCAYLLNVERSNFVSLKTYWTLNSEFDKIITTFTDQNCKPFKKEYKVDLTLLINK